MTESISPALQRIAAADVLLVAVDYDGTLAPIVSRPEEAAATPESLASLATLVALPRTHVAVVSGRALDDLVARVPAGPVLIGSHGAERGVPLDEATAARARAVQDAVRGLVGSVPGVLLEPKPVGVAVHVRNASRPDAARTLAVVRGVVDCLQVSVTEGKEVLELAVVETSKGRALADLRTSTGATAVLFGGDDVTDETAFAVLGPHDLGVKVGDGDTQAAYRVEGPAELAALLAELAAARARHLAG